MAEQFYTIPTNIGKAAIANASTLGTKVNFTHFALGDGNGSYYNPTETQTELINEVWRGQIGSITVDKENPNWIVLETIIPASIGGFMIREAGVFDVDGNLLAVGKYPETYKPVVADGSAKDLCVRMTLEVANTSVVNLKIDPTIILATKKDIDVLSNRITKNENDITGLKKEVNEHKAEIATPTQLGHVMIGSGINVNPQGVISVLQAEGVPSGIIAMWSGEVASIPGGWALCDGDNGTPDLRDRFIVGAGGDYSVGDTGGETEVTLTTAQLPSHSHKSGTLSASSAGSHSHGSGTLLTNSTGAHTHSYKEVVYQERSIYQSEGEQSARYGMASMRNDTTASGGSHSHSISGSTASGGSGQAHENRPPYFALAYIMKL